MVDEYLNFYLSCIFLDVYFFLSKQILKHQIFTKASR